MTEWAPAVDIEETDQEYVIKAELPEVNREDVKVMVQDDVLTIAGERKRENEEKSRKFHRRRAGVRKLRTAVHSPGQRRPHGRKGRVQGRNAERDASQDKGSKVQSGSSKH